MSEPTPREEAPSNSLPTWDDCALRVGNSDFLAKRKAEGGYGPEADSLTANHLHRFIYEYDDADPYRSAWFLYRLELVLNEARTLAAQLSELERISDALGMKEGHSSVDHIVAMKAKMAAQRTALLALSERIRHEGMQSVANEIEEIVK